MKANLSALALGASLTVSVSPALAQTFDMPKAGSTTYTSYALNHELATVDMGDQGSGSLIEGFGITRNSIGQKPFDRMSVHCLFYEGARGDKYDLKGACTETDVDGDKINVTFETDTFTLTGGTGKYSGISGTGTFSGNVLHAPATGTHAVEVTNKITWKMK
ncbi:hypothetical protein [Paraburkholderia sp. HP33-1]|uniref:hypothetical protein n=1 Tax=Paraburkholderia sp. HP33-1 TaxID=2883243 RepID=UPI001F3979F5|nr:hypothetical protein [Paraburkholderia sp. HP33-1]